MSATASAPNKNHLNDRLDDHHGLLFGRAPHIAHLCERVKQPGLTAVVARPQSGKSWLLQATGHQLSQTVYTANAANATTPSRLVGYHESRGGRDNLLHASADLYARWLANSSYLEQAKAVRQQQKGRFLQGAGLALAGLLDKLSDAVNEPLGKLTETSLRGLIQSSQTLNTGGLNIAPMQYEQALDISRLVHEVSGQALVFILDAWEQSQADALETEARLLSSYVKHLDEWPHCHILLGLRPESPALEHIRSLEQEFGDIAQVYEPGGMDLSNGEDQALIQHLRSELPLCAEIEDDSALLALIDQHPGVVDRWRKASNLPQHQPDGQPDGPQRLQQLSEDAHRYRYRELAALFQQLNEAQRQLAIRLALVDDAGIEHWEALQDSLLGDASASLLDQLGRCGLLETTAPPSYGHAKRAEAARRILATTAHHGLTEAANQLALAWAGGIQDADDQSLPFVLQMARLLLQYDQWLDASSRYLCHAALTLLDTPLPQGRPRPPTPESAAPLIAMGLFNALVKAKDQDDLPRRDALLQELRQLANDSPQRPVIDGLAKGLVNTMNHAKDENNLPRRDALLKELRQLSEAFPQTPAVESLAIGLFNSLTDAKHQDNLPLRDALLQELRLLTKNYPLTHIFEQIAIELLNALINAKHLDDSPLKNALIQELRLLAKDFPQTQVFEQLAKGLGSMIYDAISDANGNNAPPTSTLCALVDELEALIPGLTPGEIRTVCEQLISMTQPLCPNH